MRVVATGDHHFKQGDRWAECLRIHDWIAATVEDLEPDLFVSAGDVFDSASTPEERVAVAAFVQRIADTCPVLIVRGNHDRPRDLEILARLAGAFEIRVVEAADVHTFGVRGAYLAVGAFAWPSRASLSAALGAESAEHVAQLGRESLRRVFRGLGVRLAEARDAGAATLLVGHAHVVSARVQEQGQPLPFGEQIAVGLEDLELAGADATLLGHIHLAQEWIDRELGPIAYTGSPFRHSFGEADPKSIAVLERDSELANTAGHRWRLRRIPTPAAPMILADSPEQALEQLGRLGLEQRAAAEVRVRYAVEPDERAVRRADVARALEGVDVARLKIEEQVRPITRARAPEVAAASGLLEQLRALWATTAPDLDPAALPRLHGRVAELEAEVLS